MDLGFRMHAERTPNPNSIKWVLGREVAPVGISAHFEECPTEAVSPLAVALFDVEGVSGVFIASNFVTITKADAVEWTAIAEPVVEALKACLAEGGDALGPAFEMADRGSETEVVMRIREILDREIRPAVARDGGDIVFAGFHEGIVELYMQGSCSGCPSSTATLKHGIEARLREVIPEVLAVTAV
jgi:Fe-S cluster biogenesis protein NfuA